MVHSVHVPGIPFTASGSVSASVKAHADAKLGHVMKYISFLKKNQNIQYHVKKRVFDACLMSPMLYGCESWLNADLRPIVKLYNWCLKSSLNVRLTTCNDICYVESGYPDLPSLVKSRQRKFLCKIWRERERMKDGPLILSVKLVLENQYQTRTYIIDLLHADTDDLVEGVELLKTNIYNSGSTKRITYREINPTLSVHSVYRANTHVYEPHRVAFTRFKVSAHSLAVEVGRWNRRGRGRLPLEERLCTCGQIQTEVHVTHYSTFTQHFRNSHGFSSIQELLSDRYAKLYTRF